jgi:hypothetical protein
MYKHNFWKFLCSGSWPWRRLENPCLSLKGQGRRGDHRITRKLKKALNALPSKHPFCFHWGYSAWDFRETPLAVFLVKTSLFEWERLLQCEVCTNNVHIFLRISFEATGNRKDRPYNRRRQTGERCHMGNMYPQGTGLLTNDYVECRQVNL